MFKGALFDIDVVIADTAVYQFVAWPNLIKKYFNAYITDRM